jgi:hypothetical protein
MTTRAHNQEKIQQAPNPKLQGKDATYTVKTIDCAKALKSWRSSMFAHLWVDGDGQIKAPDHMKDREREKFETAAALIKNNTPAPMPVLGIGINDNVEIGMGASDFIAAIHYGAKTLDVHIPTSNLDEFTPFISE